MSPFLPVLLLKSNCRSICTHSASAQALQVSSNYRELEKKYGALTSIMSSQNQFITRLEKQCRCREPSQTPLVGNGHPRCVIGAGVIAQRLRMSPLCLPGAD